MKVVAAVVFCIGLAALGVLAFASRKVMLLDRALDAGDVVVLGIFAIFGTLCVALGWRLFADRTVFEPPSASERVPARAPRRVTLSSACAAAGVMLLMLSVLVPAHWYPVALFFVGLALLAASHGLTPCVERIEQLRKARASERQL